MDTAASLENIAAEIAANLIVNTIPVEHLDPLLGAPGSGNIAFCASQISERIITGALSPTFATAFVKRIVQKTQEQRGCRDRHGTNELLKILVDSCPPNVPAGKRTPTILRVLDAYQGACCGQSPCIRGKTPPQE